MGHEGTGIVVEVGAGVSRVKKDDRVLLSWMKAGGLDVPGTTYDCASDNRRVNAGGVTTFSEYAVVSENRLTKLSPEMDLADGTMVGCAIATGMGAVFNTAQFQPGHKIAVFGVGGIGLFAVSAARIAGASRVIAVDTLDARLAIAKAMGADTVIKASPDVLATLRQAVPEGFDVAIEASGIPAVMGQALECVRSQGGVAVVVGNARYGELLTIDPRQLNQGKQLRGTWGGDNNPDRHFGRYCDFIVSKRLSLAPLESRTYSLEEVNTALEDLETGRIARPIIGMRT
jgi:S-(hydroxymethyl)glutathione dehydrogenase/alcohol dehydrogenase